MDHEKNIPEYCTQNGGDCSTCSLVNYGRDCMNNPIQNGGEQQDEKTDNFNGG